MRIFEISSSSIGKTSGCSGRHSAKESLEEVAPPFCCYLATPPLGVLSGPRRSAPVRALIFDGSGPSDLENWSVVKYSKWLPICQIGISDLGGRIQFQPGPRAVDGRLIVKRLSCLRCSARMPRADRERAVCGFAGGAAGTALGSPLPRLRRVSQALADTMGHRVETGHPGGSRSGRGPC